MEVALRLPTIKAVGRPRLARARREAPAIPLDLEGRPHLQAIRVGRPDLRGTATLLGRGEAQS